MLAEDFSDNSSSLALYNHASTSEIAAGGHPASSNMAIVSNGAVQPKSNHIGINIEALLGELSDIKPSDK